MPTNTPVYGWQAPITVGGVELKHASGITVASSMTTEEVDVMAAENNVWYVANKKEVTISFTIKMFNVGGTAAEEVAPFLAAVASGDPIAITIDDATGNYICTKCDANREAGKVVSYSVELKPTITTSTASTATE